LLGQREGRRIRVHHALGQAVMVAQVNEQHAAMVADAVAPAGQANGLADVALAERAAGMGPVTMHGCLGRCRKGCRRGRNQAQKPVPNAAGFTRHALARQPSGGTVLGLENAAPSAYLGAMTVHFPFQNTYSALPANFFARVAPTPVASPRLIK